MWGFCWRMSPMQLKICFESPTDKQRNRRCFHSIFSCFWTTENGRYSFAGPCPPRDVIPVTWLAFAWPGEDPRSAEPKPQRVATAASVAFCPGSVLTLPPHQMKIEKIIRCEQPAVEMSTSQHIADVICVICVFLLFNV